MTIDCVICYFSIEDEPIRCSHNKCTNRICSDCLSSYIEFHYNGKKGIPKCPCKNGEYLDTEIRKTKNPEIIGKYHILCVNEFKNDNLDDILAETNQKLLIKKIRQERQEFVMKEYPKSIFYVIENALASKLKRLDKKNQEHVKDLKRKTNRKCFNPLCSTGILDVDFKCFNCSQQFCKKCEIHIKESDNSKHVCKQEDIDSLKLVESFVKCPKCKLPVVRSFGCNNITCSICKTNFDYTSGTLTSAGNHSNDTYKPKVYNKLSIILREDYDSEIINYLRRIEDKEPESYSFNNIITLLKKYIQIEGDNHDNYHVPELKRIASKISENYEFYKQQKSLKKDYFQIVNTIQEHHNQKTLTIDILKKLEILL